MVSEEPFERSLLPVGPQGSPWLPVKGSFKGDIETYKGWALQAAVWEWSLGFPMGP